MSASFTPGPWAVACDTEERPTLISANLFAPSGQARNGGIYVARVTGPDNEANARLIAAAPELYEALSNAREWLAGFIANAGRNADEELAEADAALTKARGQ